MAIPVPSWTRTHPVDVIPGFSAKEEGVYYPIPLLDKVAEKFGLIKSQVEMELALDLIDEEKSVKEGAERRQQKIREAYEKAYAELYNVGTAD